jgi:hypothetical protein
MSEFDKTNTWTLNRNDRRRNDKDSEFSGSINIDGKEYWLNAWVKEGKRGKFFSGSVKPKDGTKPIAANKIELNDEIPF